MTVDIAYNMLYTGALVVFALLIGCMLIRSVRGPGVTDRILCVNMIGTMVICCIMILSCFLEEGYLTDIALIYALISFVTVLIMASVYIPADAAEGRKMPRKRSRRHKKMTFRRVVPGKKGEDA